MTVVHQPGFSSDLSKLWKVLKATLLSSGRLSVIVPGSRCLHTSGSASWPGQDWAFPLPSWRWLTLTSVIIVVGFMNRATEVLKERKGSRGYQGWTDWMPHAHWYGISPPLPAWPSWATPRVWCVPVCLLTLLLHSPSSYLLWTPRVTLPRALVAPNHAVLLHVK